VQSKITNPVDTRQGNNIAKSSTMLREWKIAKLGELGTLQYGFTASAEKEPVGPKFLRITDIKGGGRISWEEVPYCRMPDNEFEKYRLRDGDILIARIGATTGKTCIVHEIPKAIFASYLIRLQIKDTADPFFVYYMMNTSTYWDQINANKEGKLKKGVSASFLKTLEIPLPPLFEQREIDKVLGTIKKAIGQQDKIIEAAKDLKKSLMQKLFREGIGHNEFEENNEIGQMPKDWNIVTIGDVRDSSKGSIVSGPFGSNIGKRFFVKEGIPLIRGNNLTKGEKLFVEEGFVFITEQKAQELRSCTALPDDLIFTAAGTLGQVGMIPKNSPYAKYIISNKQLRARIDKNKAFPLFLFYWFSGPTIQRLINQRKGGTSIPVINLGILRRLPIPLPKLEEQKQIAHILSTADKKIEVENKRKAALEELFRTLLHRFMIGEVRLKDVEV